MTVKLFAAMACLAAVSLGAADRPLMDSSRWRMPKNGGAWVENEKAIQLTVPENVEPAKADIRATLPVKIDQYAGKSILLAAEVRGEGISTGGKRWRMDGQGACADAGRLCTGSGFYGQQRSTAAALYSGQRRHAAGGDRV